MNVQELIEALQAVENKELTVVFDTQDGLYEEVADGPLECSTKKYFDKEGYLRTESVIVL